MKILAIDPGTTKSGFVLWNAANNTIENKGIIANKQLLNYLKKANNEITLIEMLSSYGKPVGAEVYETIFWIGRFYEAVENQNQKVMRCLRREIKMHHCRSVKAKDKDIRNVLIMKYGAPGTKAKQGITYGLANDMWAAFALSTYYSERNGFYKPVKR